MLTAGLATALWWGWHTTGLSGRDLVTDRFDALHTGSTTSIGGGLFTPYLIWRRQHTTEVAEHNRLHAERVARTPEKDAIERLAQHILTRHLPLASPRLTRPRTIGPRWKRGNRAG